MSEQFPRGQIHADDEGQLADGLDDHWSVNVYQGMVELYVPPAPDETEGRIMGLGLEEAVELIDGLAKAVALIRAQRLASTVSSKP